MREMTLWDAVASFLTEQALRSIHHKADWTQGRWKVCCMKIHLRSIDLQLLQEQIFPWELRCYSKTLPVHLFCQLCIVVWNVCPQLLKQRYTNLQSASPATAKSIYLAAASSKEAARVQSLPDNDPELEETLKYARICTQIVISASTFLRTHSPIVDWMIFLASSSPHDTYNSSWSREQRGEWVNGRVIIGKRNARGFCNQVLAGYGHYL